LLITKIKNFAFSKFANPFKPQLLLILPTLLATDTIPPPKYDV